MLLKKASVKIGDWAMVKPVGYGVQNVHISVYIGGWMNIWSACLPSVCLHLDKFRPINVEYTQIPVTNFHWRFLEEQSSLALAVYDHWSCTILQRRSFWTELKTHNCKYHKFKLRNTVIFFPLRYPVYIYTYTICIYLIL